MKATLYLHCLLVLRPFTAYFWKEALAAKSLKPLWLIHSWFCSSKNVAKTAWHQHDSNMYFNKAVKIPSLSTEVDILDKEVALTFHFTVRDPIFPPFNLLSSCAGSMSTKFQLKIEPHRESSDPLVSVQQVCNYFDVCSDPYWLSLKRLAVTSKQN